MKDSSKQQSMRLQKEIEGIQQVSTHAREELSQHMEKVEGQFMKDTFATAENKTIMENYLQEW